MLYEPTNTPAMARTSNLNEELGQVNGSHSILYYTFAYLKIYFPLRKNVEWFSLRLPI